MQNLQVFNNEQFGQIRTVDINGEPHFVASDVAKALGYKNVPDAIGRHCRWVVKHDIPHPQNKNKILEVNCIPIGDLFRLGASSELPGARQFESWIYDEVLPSIHKTGGYIVGQESLSDDELIARAVIVAQNKITERDKLIAEKDAKIQQMRPKEVFADAVSASTTSILIGELAKILKQNGYDTGEKRLFTWLRDHGYLIKRKGTDYNAPTQKSMKLGLFEVKETAITHADGHVTINKTTKVTGKGQQYFIDKFLTEVA